MNLTPDLTSLLLEFARHRIRYLVIGGHAVGVHARPRATKDLDLWIDPLPPNVTLACKALASFGMPSDIIQAVRYARMDDIVWVGKVPSRIDFLFSIPGIPDFESAWSRRVTITLAGNTVPIIGKADLIANKRTVGRPRDRRDVKALESSKKA